MPNPEFNLFIAFRMNYRNEFRLAWWKYGSQPDQPIRDVNPTVNSGGLFRIQPNPKPVFIPTNGRRPTPTIPIPIFRAKFESTTVPNTPLPSFPTPTTEQFTATPRRTYPTDKVPTWSSKTDSTTVPVTDLPTFSKPADNPEVSETRYMTNSQQPDPTNNPTQIPTTRSSFVPTFSRPGTKTSYTTDNQLSDQTIHPTTVPETKLPTFTRRESTRRSTRRPVTTSSVRTTTTTTTRPKKVKIPFEKSLKSEKYDCNIFGFDCKYRKQYKKLLQDAQGN